MSQRKDYVLVWRHFAKGTTEWKLGPEGIETIPGSHLYEIDSDYDFGSICPEDVAVEMFENGIQKQPGVCLTTVRAQTF